jgi:hypothetical protein
LKAEHNASVNPVPVFKAQLVALFATQAGVVAPESQAHNPSPPLEQAVIAYEEQLVAFT